MPGRERGISIGDGETETRETTRVTHSEIEHLAKHPYSKRHDCSFMLRSGTRS